MDSYRIIRVLTWFQKDGDALVGEEALKGITVDELQRLFGTSPDDPMYAEYPARAPHVPRLQQCVNHRIDLNAFEYFVGAFQEDGS